MKTYSSPELGFTVKYPADWIFKDRGKQIDITSNEEGYTSAEAGAGVMILVESLEAEDEGDPARVFERLMKDNDTGIEFAPAAVRLLGGSEWYTVSFADAKNNAAGDLFLLIKGLRVYVIGSFFKRPEEKPRFEAAVEGILTSFHFSEPKMTYKEFRDKKKGVSFRHPADAEIKDEPDSVQIVLGKNPFSATSGALLAVGLFGPQDEKIKDLDEKGLLEYIKKSGEKVTIVTALTPFKLLKQTWYRSEILADGGKMTFIVKKMHGYFFTVFYLVKPADGADAYQPVFDELLRSLALDPKQWIKSLGQQKK